MTPSLKILSFISIAIGATACGQTEHTPHSVMDHSTMKHSENEAKKNSYKSVAGDTGHSRGTIISVSSDGHEVTINHKEIEGIGMGAMTMGFSVIPDVDLSRFSKQDPVSFMVKKGQDGNYIITSMCNTNVDGAGCLNAKIDASGH